MQRYGPDFFFFPGGSFLGVEMDIPTTMDSLDLMLGAFNAEGKVIHDRFVNISIVTLPN